MRILTKTLFSALLFATCWQQGEAKNTVRRNGQVTTAVEVTGKWDFSITTAVPIADGGTVDIINPSAVVIFEQVKPSVAAKYLSKVKINGVAAKDGTNCQLKLYNRGSIILPYADKDMLTVYSEQNFGGDAVSTFGLENSGGFMNTLSEAKLNNKIRSFKLKRGYMVTFSTLPNGRGYSRCFIAADEDLEVSTLPTILDQRISSYRVFRWYDTGKACLANDTRAEAVSALNVTSCYSFSLGESRLPDAECVPHHIYEDWPSAAACGSVTYSPHLKTNNEPGNSADDHPQSVDEILRNWENLMATGMRLCSPSSHDGSLDHLRQVLKAIDERGWRCDIVDLHCYWPEWNLKNQVKGWYDSYGRPVWVSEWVWGASWNNNGIFGEASSRDNPTDTDLARNKTVIQGVCENWNAADYIERYYYWNSEANCSKIYMNGKLTPAGEYYASINSGLGYKGTNYVPKTPPMYAATDFKVAYDKTDGSARLTWNDKNGEYNREMTIERTDDKGVTWTTLATVTQRESPSSYSFTDANNVYDGVGYRVHIVDINGVTRNSEVTYTQIADVEAGDGITVDGQRLYVGGNMLRNGDFNDGVEGWTNGAGTTPGQPYFQVVPVGGPDGGAYLQCYGHKGVDDVASLKTYVEVQPNTYYFFRCASVNGGSNLNINVSPDKTSTGAQAAKLSSSADWQTRYVTFNSGNNPYVVISFSMLGAKAQFDKMELRQLFATAEAATADGEAKAPTAADLMHQQARVAQQKIDSLLTVADVLQNYEFPGREALVSKAAAARTVSGDAAVIEACVELGDAVAAYCPMTAAPKQPTMPNFTNTNGWTVKAGTFTGGDQRTNTVGGKTCWNAWWSNISASEGAAKTMEVHQEVAGLDEGLYSLECKATTEHYCLSDQHGFIVSGSDQAVTPPLRFDYFDLPVANVWETLTTTPVYVAKDGTVTIGFTSSKQGAVDNAWRAFGSTTSTGDRREGWWCATEFRLLFHPLAKISSAQGEWGAACLPYAALVPTTARCYSVAGVLKDHSALCLEEITGSLEAGRAFIYQSSAGELTFSEYGAKAGTPVSSDANNNLRGYLANSRISKGYYELVNGRWTKVESSKSIVAGSAFLTKLEGLTEYDSWAGATLPIDGETVGIKAVATDTNGAGGYSVSGRAATNSRGIVIKADGRKVLK